MADELTIKQMAINAIQLRKGRPFTPNDIWKVIKNKYKVEVNRATLDVTITRDLKDANIVKPYQLHPSGRAKSYVEVGVTPKTRKSAPKKKVKTVKTQPAETSKIVDAAEFGEAIIQYIGELKKKIAALEFGFEDEARKHQADLAKKDDLLKEKDRDIERLNSQVVSSNARIKELNEENESLQRQVKRSKGSTFNLGELSHVKQPQSASPN